MKFCRKIAFISFVGLFMFSDFPLISMAQEVAEDPNHEVYVEIIKEATIHINEDMMVGTIHEGTQLGVEKIEAGNVYFRLGNEIAYIEEENIENITNSDKIALTPVEFEVDEAKEKITIFESTEVYADANFDNVILTLDPEREYEVSKSEDGHYFFTFGDKLVVINEPDVERLDQELESNSDENMIQQENPTLVEPSLEEPIDEPIDAAVDPSTNLELVEEDAFATVASTVEIAQFTAKDRFFEVTEDKVSIYDNSTGSLQVVGYLNKGQEFPRVADFGADLASN